KWRQSFATLCVKEQHERGITLGSVPSPSIPRPLVCCCCCKPGYLDANGRCGLDHDDAVVVTADGLAGTNGDDASGLFVRPARWSYCRSGGSSALADRHA